MCECNHHHLGVESRLAEHDSGESSSEEEFDSQEVVDDWVLYSASGSVEMLAVTLMESFKKCQKMNVKEAVTEAGSIVGFNEKSVIKYRNNFLANKGALIPLKQGKYERHTVYHDEHMNHIAAQYIRGMPLSRDSQI